METQENSELTIVRVINAPREEVWQAWTEPEMLKKWWGPEHFSAPVAELEPKVGGKLFMCMQDPEGKLYCDIGRYKELIPYKKIVYTDSFADEQGKKVSSEYYGMSGFADESIITVNLEDIGGKTLMTIINVGFTDPEVKEGAREGWGQSIDKMERVLQR